MLGGSLFVAGLSGHEGEQTGQQGPRFHRRRPRAAPGANWVTNGGNVYNQRYSSLRQINRDNVAQVKAVWRTSLNGSGLGQGYSQQAQALFYDGIIYVVTGDNDVFAVDVETGKILWTYEANVDFDNTVICCGRLSRGVGLGDGKVYVGRLDGRLVALDQRTGKVVWDISAGDPASARHHGGAALLRRQGHRRLHGWRVRRPRPHQRLRREDRQARLELLDGAGARRDRSRDLAAGQRRVEVRRRAGVANAERRPRARHDLFLDRQRRAGSERRDSRGRQSLHVSLVALDANTGQYRWHFQLVRHDIWDFDAANPTILFDADFDGMRRKGITAVSKGGYLYILDRTSGVPLTPVVETPVPQDKIQKTAATQPIPQGDQVVRHEVDAVGENFEGILRNRARTFTPFSTGSSGNLAALLGRYLAPGLVQPHEQPDVPLRRRRPGPRHGRRCRLRRSARSPAPRRGVTCRAPSAARATSVRIIAARWSR